MSKLLINENPLIVLPSLVTAVGIERAIILQQIHFACQQPRSGKTINGHKYVFNTYEDWQRDHFPFWSAKNIQKHIRWLEDKGYVESIQPHLKSGDATKYYRVATHSLLEGRMGSTGVEDGVYWSRPSIKEQRLPTKTSHKEKNSAPQEQASARKQAFDLGVKCFTDVGESEAAARTFLGKLLKMVKDDDDEALRLVKEMARKKPVDPKSYLGYLFANYKPKSTYVFVEDADPINWKEHFK